MKHKNSEVLHAFADGIECETWYGDKWVKTTDLFEFDHFEKIRIKPEPKPDVVDYLFISDKKSSDLPEINWVFVNTANLKLTFDGETGILKSAEVIQ
jgi:hypothetical protein